MRFRVPLSVLLLFIALGLFAPVAEARFLTGFFDPLFTEGNSRWLGRANELGGSDTIVRINVNWAATARTRPDNPRAPNDRAYDWDRTDNAVLAADRAGVNVLLTFQVAPSWAEGRGHQNNGKPGTWKPRPAAVGDFAFALARRYDGDHVPPGETRRLPAVRNYQVWNEESIAAYLQPQWDRRNGRWVPVSPDHYRLMLNEAYEAVNTVNRANFVLAGGFAPYGDPPGGRKMFPAYFARKLLCLNDRLQETGCPVKAKFDAFDIHPYQQNWHPGKKATRADDIRIPDIGEKLGRPLRRAAEQGTVSGPKEIWTTEFGWDTKPPTSYGISKSLQKRYLAEAFYRLYGEGVDAATWYRIVDSMRSRSVGSAGARDQSKLFFGMGVHFKGGNPKPSSNAFRFMFVTQRIGSRRIRYWGRAPAAGEVKVQRKAGGSFATIASDQTGPSQVFEGTVRLGRGDQTLRALMPRGPGSQDDKLSPTWEQR